MKTDYHERGMARMDTNRNTTHLETANRQSTWFESVIRRIGDEVTPDEYLSFGLKLGVPREMSENIRANERDVFPEATISLLRQWMRKLGFTPEQLADELLRGLRAVQLDRLANTLQEEIKKNEEEWRAFIQPNINSDSLSTRLESQIVSSTKHETGGSRTDGNTSLMTKKRKPKANYLIQPKWKFY